MPCTTARYAKFPQPSCAKLLLLHPIGFLPVEEPAAYVLVTLLSVGIQEVARYGLWILHRYQEGCTKFYTPALYHTLFDFCCRRSVAALNLIAQKRSGTLLTEQDQHAMSLTHGFAHGICQSVLLCIR